MTLRTRLTGAFLLVVLGPILVAAVFVTIAGRSVNAARDHERLDVAATAFGTIIDASCVRLQAAAASVAALTLGGTQLAAASTAVGDGQASAIRIDGNDGRALLTTRGAPALPWVLCAGAPVAATAALAVATDVPGAIAAAVQMRTPAGAIIGYAYAAQALDTPYLRQLSVAVGANVTVRSAPGLSTEPASTARALASDGATFDAKIDGRYARAVAPIDGQALTFVVSIPETGVGALTVIVLSVVLGAVAVAVLAAWALARGTVRPLDELTEAADRIANGALDTRVPVRHGDQVGQLGAAFNRITREMQTYVDALTASRGQLRGNLNVLGDTLSSTHDLPRILRVILDSAITATGAARGAVLLVEGPDRRLAVQCSEGFDEPTTTRLTSTTMPSGTGLLGSVAETGIPQRGRMTAEGPQLASEEPRCGTYLVVPLQLPAADGASGASPTANKAAASRVRGVLALYDGLGDGDFNETDLRTVRAFAGHAAVAVDNVRLHDEAQRLSHTDPLTGLYNYRHLQEVLSREVSRSGRFGHSLCVLLLDLDRFKEVNDSYGHAAGDAVLAEFARRIAGEIRGVDLAFRVGGEEFVLLLPETGGPGGTVLAQRLVAAVRSAPMKVPDALRANADLVTVEMPLVRRIEGDASENRRRACAAIPARHVAQVPITVSIGVAVYPDHGATGEQVLAAADAALYAAKEAGRDTYRQAVAAESPDPARSAAVDDNAVVPEPRGESAPTGESTATRESAPACESTPTGESAPIGESAPAGESAPTPATGTAPSADHAEAAIWPGLGDGIDAENDAGAGSWPAADGVRPRRGLDADTSMVSGETAVDTCGDVPQPANGGASTAGPPPQSARPR